MKKMQGKQVGAKDPVCGMKVPEANNKITTNHDGTTYQFCSEECKTKFDANPKKFAHRKAS